MPENGFCRHLGQRMYCKEFLLWLSRLRIQLESMRMWVQSLALLSGLRILCCRELWHRSQMWFGFGIAVAVVSAGSCSSNLTLSLGTRICLTCSPKKKKRRRMDCKTLPDIHTRQATYLWGSGFSKCGPRLWASIPPRDLLEIILRLHPRPVQSETPGLGPAVCFNKSSGWFRCMFKFEHHCLRASQMHIGCS